MKVIVADPVTKGDWFELIGTLIGVNGPLEIAAWSLGLEPTDLEALLWSAAQTIEEEGDYFWGHGPTIRISAAVSAFSPRPPWERKEAQC